MYQVIVTMSDPKKLADLLVEMGNLGLDLFTVNEINTTRQPVVKSESPGTVQKRKRGRQQRARKRWTIEEEILLLNMRDEHKSESAIARELHRSRQAIASKLWQFDEKGAKDPRTGEAHQPSSDGYQRRRRWSEEEDQKLRDMVDAEYSVADMEDEIDGRTVNAIYNRLERLGLAVPVPSADTD